MHGHWLDNIRRLFPCFSDIADHHWTSSEIIRVTPDTPHAIREGHVLQHAMFMINGSIRVFKLSPSGKEITIYRLYGSRSRHTGGMGLGLAIAKEFVEAHKGVISVRSEVDRGTQFTVYLPCA